MILLNHFFVAKIIEINKNEIKINWYDCNLNKNNK